MSNSPLVSYTKLSPNHSGKRTMPIDRITPHCVVGQCSVETLGNVFAPASRNASCNYGIGSDGRVGMYVPEDTISWCSSSHANDVRAVTIECASDMTEPYYMNPKVYATLVKLCVDICKRNGKKKLLWLNDKVKTFNYVPKADEMILTVHRWFASKSCPGDWLYSRLGNLAKEVTEQLNGSTASKGRRYLMWETYQIDGKSTVYWFDGQKVHKLYHAGQLKVIRRIYKDNTKEDLKIKQFTKDEDKRLREAIKA